MSKTILIYLGALAIVLALLAGIGSCLNDRYAEVQETASTPEPLNTPTPNPTPTATPVPGTTPPVRAPNGCTLVRSREDLETRLMARFMPTMTHPELVRGHFYHDEEQTMLRLRQWTLPTHYKTPHLTQRHTGYFATYVAHWNRHIQSITNNLRMFVHITGTTAPPVQLQGYDKERLDRANLPVHITYTIAYVPRGTFDRKTSVPNPWHPRDTRDIHCYYLERVDHGD